VRLRAAAIGPVPSSVYITTCPQLAKAAERAADEGAGFDPGCVKTHTSAKCRKYNSPVWDRAVLAQYDLTLMMRNFFEIFYARNER
jgi:hypothetical protein